MSTAGFLPLRGAGSLVARVSLTAQVGGGAPCGRERGGEGGAPRRNETGDRGEVAKDAGGGALACTGRRPVHVRAQASGTAPGGACGACATCKRCAFVVSVSVAARRSLLELRGVVEAMEDVSDATLKLLARCK